MYYGDTIEGLEGFYEISTKRNFLTPHSLHQAVELVEDNLSDHGRVGSSLMQAVRKDLFGDTLHGEDDFFRRVQKLRDAMNANNREAASLMVQAVSKHFEADTILSQALNTRCKEEYRSMASQQIKTLEAGLSQMVSSGMLSFSKANEQLETAKREAESKAFQQFYQNDGQKRVASAIWAELATSPNRVRLLSEADDFEEKAMLLLA
ncbi:hypothetical protein [Shimazuella kribbensis]|uniref:hypothetical protein n=1 Tax=Shimazuella kribbensis TaxID=139808 RepID=UPI0012EC2441|nr:hypothetical protein [Shimazuella kribbensis]